MKANSIRNTFGYNLKTHTVNIRSSISYGTVKLTFQITLVFTIIRLLKLILHPIQILVNYSKIYMSVCCYNCADLYNEYRTLGNLLIYWTGNSNIKSSCQTLINQLNDTCIHTYIYIYRERGRERHRYPLLIDWLLSSIQDV